MTWKYNDPKHGDTRTVTRFLLFPKHLEGVAKWLCRVNIIQEYEGQNYADDGWKDVKFCDRKADRH